MQAVELCETWMPDVHTEVVEVSRTVELEVESTLCPLSPLMPTASAVTVGAARGFVAPEEEEEMLRCVLLPTKLMAPPRAPTARPRDRLARPPPVASAGAVVLLSGLVLMNIALLLLLAAR